MTTTATPQYKISDEQFRAALKANATRNQEGRANSIIVTYPGTDGTKYDRERTLAGPYTFTAEEKAKLLEKE